MIAWMIAWMSVQHVLVWLGSVYCIDVSWLVSLHTNVLCQFLRKKPPLFSDRRPLQGFFLDVIKNNIQSVHHLFQMIHQGHFF